MRNDGLIDDAVGDGVRQRSLETGAHLDTHAPVILGDQQDDAVLDALAPELPCVGDPDAELLDFLGLGRGHDQHRDLAALLGLEGGELGLDAVDHAARQGSREVGDPRRERRHCDLGARGERGQNEEQRCRGVPQWAGAAGGALSDAPVPAGEPPKSTLGGLEIAASFSTAKFGFTL